jgi:NAD(P)-dependent dehydrogenase (short-subunit alcohol dehydrogenase family)
MSDQAHGMLPGRDAIVIGTDAIGQGIARRFEREGARVVAVAGPAASAADAASAVQEVSALVASGARLDVLVCNLLPAPAPAALEAISDLRLAAALQAVTDSVALMRAALPALRASGRGRIILIGHRYGESVAEGLAAYNAAAWALVGIARSAAVEWGQFGITTNLLLPLAATPEFEAACAQRPAIIGRLVAQLPLRRVGDPERDIGGAAAFIASEAACFVNGQVICADGGQQVAGPVLNPVRFT